MLFTQHKEVEGKATVCRVGWQEVARSQRKGVRWDVV